MRGPSLLAASLLIAACTAPDEPVIYDLSQSIIGGEEVKNNDFASVGLLDFGATICTGTVLEDGNTKLEDDGTWIITAAHCVDGAKANNTRFLLGNNFQDFEEEATFQAKKLFRPAPFNLGLFFLGHDIALVELEEPVPTELNGVKIPRIPFSVFDAEQFIGEKFIAVGFGNDNGQQGTGAGTKRVAEILIESTTDEHIVFGENDGTPNTCQGDSGGPAFIDLNGDEEIDENDVVIAVTSGGAGGCLGRSFSQRTDSQFEPFLDVILNSAIRPEQPHFIADGFCEVAGSYNDPDCRCKRDGLCDRSCLAQQDGIPDSDCVLDLNNGCLVGGAPAGTDYSPFALGALFSLALLSLYRRSPRPKN